MWQDVALANFNEPRRHDVGSAAAGLRLAPFRAVEKQPLRRWPCETLWEEWETTNYGREPTGFVITGWHKRERYSEYAPTPWYQSRAKVFFSDATKVSVGFEDLATDADFDDAFVTVNIFPPAWPMRPFIVPGYASFTARHLLAFVFGAMAGGIAGLLFHEAVRTWWTGLGRGEP